MKKKLIHQLGLLLFNEKSIVSEDRVTQIPKILIYVHFTLFGCAVTSTFGAVNNDANLKLDNQF